MPDSRYKYLQSIWKAGDLTSLKDIFGIVPRSIVATDIGLNYGRFSQKVLKPELFTFRDILRLAKYTEIDPKVLAEIVLKDIEAIRNPPKKTRNGKRPQVHISSQAH
jgi:hypothetical protein